MRYETMGQLTPCQSQVQISAATANIDNDQTDDDIAKNASTNITVTIETKKIKYDD